ncbi:MAG: hypothetical protein SGBAC_005103 [Bacillariaceae sp.]
MSTRSTSASISSQQEPSDNTSTNCSLHATCDESCSESSETAVASLCSPRPSRSRKTTTSSSSASPAQQVSAVPPSIFAQHFNNKGVKALNYGNYRKAINLFVKAIQALNDAGTDDYCQCEHCRVFSSVHHTLVQDAKTNAYDTSDDHYVHRRGISIRPEAMGHKMGGALLQIATLNLAITKHLICLECPLSDERAQAKKYQKAASFYEMAFKSHVGESQDQNTVNIAFFLIIVNNLAQIHREADNRSKEIMCRDHLQSALMTLLTNNEDTELYHSLDLDGFCRTAFSTAICASAA